MIRKPCPDPIAIGLIRLSVFTFLLLVLCGWAEASSLYQIQINTPKKISARQDITIEIRLSDFFGHPLKDRHLLDVEIFNGDRSATMRVVATQGVARLNENFQNPGATMISVRDHASPSLVEYQAFVVQSKPVGKR